MDHIKVLKAKKDTLLSEKRAPRSIKVLFGRILKYNRDIKSLDSDEIKIEKEDGKISAKFDADSKKYFLNGKLVCKNTLLEIECEVKLKDPTWIPFVNKTTIFFIERKLKKIFFKYSKGLFVC